MLLEEKCVFNSANVYPQSRDLNQIQFIYSNFIQWRKWGTFTNGCVLCMEVVELIGAPLDAGLRELRLQEVEKRSCMIDRGLGVLPQPPAQTCCSALMALFMLIGVSQVSSWPYSFQAAMEVQWKLLMLWDIRRCAQDGFLRVSQLSTDVKGKPSVLNCWSVLMLRGRPFCPGSSQVTKPGLIVMSRRQKGSQWSGIIRNRQEKRSPGQFLPPERS